MHQVQHMRDDIKRMYVSRKEERIELSCVEYFIRGAFQTFFVQVFKIVIDSWKSSRLLLNILWDDRLIFMIPGLNEQLQQELEYTLLKPDSHSWWISKMLSGH